MRKIEDVTLKDGKSLKEVLELHKKWLEGEKDGKRGDLSYEYLSDVDLKDINLKYVFLIETNLSDANLRGADLRGASLKGANLRSAKLTDANLSGANLTKVNLIDADLTGIKYNNATISFELQCPEKGSFIGYKKADNKIVELLITEDAKRSSATTRRCRCSKAKVLSITSLDGKENFEKVNSDYDSDFIYEVGKTVEVKNFDNNRWNECAPGIHFFITRNEAVRY